MKYVIIAVIGILGLGALVLGFVFISDWMKSQNLQYQYEIAQINADKQSQGLGLLGDVLGFIGL